MNSARRTDRETGPPLHDQVVALRDGDRTDAFHERLLPPSTVVDEHRYVRPGEEPLVADAVDTDVCVTIREGAWRYRRHRTPTPPSDKGPSASARASTRFSATPL